jgi:hypothetical protein
MITMAQPATQKAKNKNKGNQKKNFKKKDKDKKKDKHKKVKLTARNADKFVLYQQSVQEPEADVKFLNRVFKKEHDRAPRTLREDFCGTAWLCAEWVRSHPERTAVGLDLDGPTLDWGREYNIAPLGDDAGRASLLKENVLHYDGPASDVVVAFNFSYCILRERPQLLEYFRAVVSGLGEDGMFALDIHGGPECFEEIEETTQHKGFDYVWDQGPVDPISHLTHRRIHFEFRDGTRLKEAFGYHWRVWTLPELRDLLLEAGFRRVDVYWEGYDENGEGNGIFRKVQKAENDESWIAYVVAFR